MTGRSQCSVVKVRFIVHKPLYNKTNEVIFMGIQENISVFEDTWKFCKTNPAAINAIKLSNHRQEVFLEGNPVCPIPKAKADSAKIIVSKKRSFEAAKQYVGYEACVLNFASSINPGGGVVWGATAQEECLCRCSTLYSNLIVKENWECFYEPHRSQNNPLYNDDCIYTPDVLVFKTDTGFPELMKQEAWMQVNVISCAAPNLQADNEENEPVEITDLELEQLHIKRMRRILSIAASKGNDVVILGAFGCGAFKNPPQVVAKAMKKVIREFRNYFEVIEFAVYCSPKDEQNFTVFKKILGEAEEQ